MDLTNKKLDWQSILKEQIEWQQKLYPQGNISESYDELIPLLTENKVPSRVIFSNGKALAYAFFILPTNGDDRMYSTMGFSNREIEDEKIINLLKWLYNESDRLHKTLVMNGIFNEPNNFRDLLKENGFNIMDRVRMELIIKESSLPDSEIDLSGYELTEISSNNISDLSGTLFDSFRGIPERILLPSREDAMKPFLNEISNGVYGGILRDSSYRITMNGDDVGGIIFTDGGTETEKMPLLLFLFILEEFRGMKLSRSIIANSLRTLNAHGYKSCQLWVDRNNFAYRIYKAIGFVEKENEKFPIYYKVPS
ncbi:MAG: GNAT family N-acetyltransferase [Thermoplasmataceae archaeon]